jgi:hypothetical protein
MAEIEINHKDQVNAATEIIPEAETIATGIGYTVFIARSRITLRKITKSE